MQHWVSVTIILALALSGCGKKKEAPTFAGANLPPDVAGNTAPSTQTAALNASVADSLPLADQQDFDDAQVTRSFGWPAQGAGRSGTWARMGSSRATHRPA